MLLLLCYVLLQHSTKLKAFTPIEEFKSLTQNFTSNYLMNTDVQHGQKTALK